MHLRPTRFILSKEFKTSDKLKNKIVSQAITDPEYIKKVYRMEHGATHSLASGVITSVPTVKEYIENLIKEAEEIMAEFQQWGMLA